MSLKSKQCESVKVVVRCRPLNRREEACGYDSIVDMDVKVGQVALRNPRAAPGEPDKTFTFDAVYDAGSKQSDLYDESVRPLVDSVLRGFNGTVLAYGQTGTGKTYTMQGDWTEAERRGIMPSSFEHIFTHISRSQNQQYLVRASYLEIYQEEIRDLLTSDHSKRLELKESPESGVYVRDLSSFVAKNVKEMEHVLNAATFNYDETLTTLRYANRAKNIKNVPRVNEDPKDALLREFQQEIARLKAQLQRRGMLSTGKKKGLKKAMDHEVNKDDENEEEKDGVQEDDEDDVDEEKLQKEAQEFMKEQQEMLEQEKEDIIDDRLLVAEEKQKLLEEKEKMMGDLKKEQEATAILTAKFKDEETLELRETFTSLQQEVEAKTKKLKKNFIPPEEKNKIINRLVFDVDEDQWKFQPLVSAENKFTQMKRRPASAVGYKRPISQYAKVAIAMGANSRYRAENIMLLELDMTPPTLFQMDFSRPGSEPEPSRDVRLDNTSYREKVTASRVRKSQSWCQVERPMSSSSSAFSLSSSGSTGLAHPINVAMAAQLSPFDPPNKG
ncbi:Kinesin-like protein KIF3C [Bagarius yarrelli]|uniref:Kinesin-like protein KIF3C n=1 Tax=Bagarius yarrelli TaxID=175774 RepID=A0A556U8U1_BAGYA|nr:Kinesin-like protein KIF3C [Bagarius yarrelli]